MLDLLVIAGKALLLESRHARNMSATFFDSTCADVTPSQAAL
jgi:hypothetical protein